VEDVSTSDKALAAGLAKHPGFDLLATRPGEAKRAIEVKGRAGGGEIELTENEWERWTPLSRPKTGVPSRHLVRPSWP